jgi:hypothetical protein
MPEDIPKGDSDHYHNTIVARVYHSMGYTTVWGIPQYSLTGKGQVIYLPTKK